MLMAQFELISKPKSAAGWMLIYDRFYGKPQMANLKNGIQ